MTRDRINAHFRKKAEELAGDSAATFQPSEGRARAALRALRLEAEAERILDRWVAELKPGQGAKA